MKVLFLCFCRFQEYLYIVYYTSLFVLKHFLQKQLGTKQMFPSNVQSLCVCCFVFLFPTNDALYIVIFPPHFYFCLCAGNTLDVDIRSALVKNVEIKIV